MRRGSSQAKGLVAKPKAPVDDVLSTFVIELALPLGIGLTEKNVISEVQPSASTLWKAGDKLCWADGQEVRGGIMSVGEALDKSRKVHEFVVQRGHCLLDKVEWDHTGTAFACSATDGCLYVHEVL